MMYTNRENIPAERRASAVSRFVSWYSGAKLAQTSTPYADQHIRNSHINATPMSLKPSTLAYSTLVLSHLPVRNGQHDEDEERHDRASTPVT